MYSTQTLSNLSCAGLLFKKGYALVHGATIAFGDKAYMITARTDTGKTTTLLKILAYQRRNSDQAAFLSDDMTIVSPTGTAMTYPKPLTISYHTLRAVNTDTLNFKEKITPPIPEPDPLKLRPARGISHQ